MTEPLWAWELERCLTVPFAVYAEIQDVVIGHKSRDLVIWETAAAVGSDAEVRLR